MTIYRNRSIDRALGLLEALRDARAGLGLTELAGRTGLELSTAFRLVSVLVERRYVHYDVQSRRYSLGYGSFRLAQPDHVLRAVRRMSQRFLSRLAVELGATVLLGELHGPRLCIYAEGKGGQASPYGVRVRRPWARCCWRTGRRARWRACTLAAPWCATRTQPSAPWGSCAGNCARLNSRGSPWRRVNACRGFAH